MKHNTFERLSSPDRKREPASSSFIDRIESVVVVGTTAVIRCYTHVDVAYF